MRTKKTATERDIARLRTLAGEVLRQCDHYERNAARGEDDLIRGLIIDGDVNQMHVVTARMERRYRKARAART